MTELFIDHESDFISFPELALDASMQKLLAVLAEPTDDGREEAPGQVLDRLLWNPESIPSEIRSLPLFRKLLRRTKVAQRDAIAAAQEQKKKERKARALAKANSVECWPVLMEPDVDVSAVVWFEREMLARGWLESKSASEYFSSVWQLSISGYSPAARVFVDWPTLRELLPRMRSNARALELALVMEVQKEYLVKVDGRTPSATIERVQRLLVEFKSASAGPAQVLERLTWSGWRMLARVSASLRWSLLHKIEERPSRSRTAFAAKPPLGLRDLNWAQYAKALRSPAVRMEMLPPSLQWEALVGLPAPRARVPAMPGVKISTLKALLNLAELSTPESVKADRGNILPILNLVRLFGDEQSIRRYVTATRHTWDRKGLHDAGQFTLADRGWTPSKWAPLCLRHPQAVKHAGEFPALESKGVIPRSWSELQAAVLRMGYPECEPGMESLREVCLRDKLSPLVFKETQAFWKKAELPLADFMPFVAVDSAELGLTPGWRLTRLLRDDFRGPLLGHFTGCCQHLSGAGSSCAVHGVQSPFSAFYVVTFKGQIFAQSWAWRSRTGAVVWDSVESRPASDEEVGVIAQLYLEASTRMVGGALQVPAVLMGDSSSGLTERVLRALRARKPGAVAASEQMADYCEYRDGHHQRCIAGRLRKTAVKFPHVEGYTRNTQTHKVLEVLREAAEWDPIHQGPFDAIEPTWPFDEFGVRQMPLTALRRAGWHARHG